jgi:hypothetical protein
MKILQILILVLGIFVVANAQKWQSLTELEGKVIDQGGAIIPLAKIVLTNSKGKKFASITDEDGEYLLRIPAGTYTVEAEYTEYRAWEKFKVEKYEIAPTRKMMLDICLRVDEEFIKTHGTQVIGDPIKVKKKPKSP